MKVDIEKALVKLQIEGKETRKRTARNVLITILLTITFFVIPYGYPQFSVLYVVFVLIIFFGGWYVVFSAIPTLYQPTKKEYYAFQKIAHSIQVLEKLKEPIAYEEAYRDLDKAYEVLKDMNLNDDCAWYSKTNETLRKFFENLQLVVLPAIANSDIKIEHLEEIALALYSLNPSALETANAELEKEPSYKRNEPSPSKIVTLTRTFRQSIIGKVFVSLALGYGIVLIVCLVYVLATNQDFMTFAKERPDIVVLGGLVASGITFWKSK